MKYKHLIYCLVFILTTSSFVSCNNRHRNRPTPREMRGERKIEKAQSERENSQGRKSVVKMRKSGGVYYVPCKINGTEMDFIFDTGASDITMSLTEARFLYKQEKLTNDDFIGTQQYIIADGSICEGMIVMLQKVEIGNRTLYNIQASIVDNMDAPLLLGQSALAKFGKISIDYNRNEITFE